MSAEVIATVAVGVTLLATLMPVLLYLVSKVNQLGERVARLEALLGQGQAPRRGEPKTPSRTA